MNNIEVACFVLGVKDRFRGEDLIRDLSAKGFAPEILWGIDASSAEAFALLNTQVDHAASRLLQGRNLSLGEVACSLGHLAIQEKFLKSSEEWALIFEDDVVLRANLSEIFPHLAKLKKPTVIQLHHSIPDDKTVLRRKRFPIAAQFAEEAPYYLVEKLNFSSGSYAYFINRSAARIAVEASTGKKIINIPDWPYLWRHKVNFWELTINLASYQGESLLDADRKSASEVLHKTHYKRVRLMNRVLTFLNNVLGIPAYKFHQLGYPARIVYFNNVIMPFKRRAVILQMRALSKWNSLRKVDLTNKS